MLQFHEIRLQTRNMNQELTMSTTFNARRCTTHTLHRLIHVIKHKHTQHITVLSFSLRVRCLRWPRRIQNNSLK